MTGSSSDGSVATRFPGKSKESQCRHLEAQIELVAQQIKEISGEITMLKQAPVRGSTSGRRKKISHDVEEFSL